MLEVPEFVPHLNSDLVGFACNGSGPPPAGKAATPGVARPQGESHSQVMLILILLQPLPLGGWNLPVPFSVGNCYLSLRYPDGNCIVVGHGQPIVQPAAASFFSLLHSVLFIHPQSGKERGQKAPGLRERARGFKGRKLAAT